MSRNESSKPVTSSMKAAVDLQHMPQFIKDAPWYLNQNTGSETLHHQRQKQPDKKQSIYTYHQRGFVAPKR